MKNISLNTESLELNADQTYIIIDALYLSQIKEEFSIISTSNTLDDIRDKVFPYTEYPFAKYAPEKKIFSLDKIKKSNQESYVNNESVFSSDTGVLVFVNENILLSFAKLFDYENLVDSEVDLINFDYWNSITKGYNNNDIALVVSPGINSGLQFDGGGIYVIV